MRNSTLKETLKTIALSVLIAGIVSFALGIRYERSNSLRLEQLAKDLKVTQAPLK